MKKLLMTTLCVAALGLTGCATEGSRAIAPTVTQAASTAANYHGVKSAISVGKFDNKSSFQNGVFSDGQDQLGNQSKTILVSHLQQTGRFSVLDRTNMSEAATEAKIKGQKQKLKGATYVITGDVTEFGRKTVGDHQLFGILGRGKEQVAYAKVTLNVVNVNTSEVAYSVQGAGEYNLSNREVLGFGGTAGYDSTLNGKVLDLAIREAVNNLVNGIEAGHWTPAK
ncbi:CsgG/HfaB family protein [Actinobacillus equuli subsp. equuli]|uniref:Curli production assembly/transport component CsgG n=1 Tax=Actinobacillus equuli TaxID=718 RepID=A0AAX3FKS6_ACTEU|nr:MULTISPECIES: CsgG/HfaB family protein [Actinobacillus]AIZ78509.1 membrane protein [Actinobacillus equuli subsp. equuli]WGE35032.1 CsgG/HfaB family protein [Actinobacillus genomosp. 1]WGE44778.1 CsgG/HfaB family protein [Actinobacillus equuli subsp. equuli]WGE55409.1 CsgG/HfaB family protein [Actinobacillus equuli subsp. equuli]WGE57501.1 CsgG/HfaB family protein [Actinobacillus equuli subsp. equuli]